MFLPPAQWSCWWRQRPRPGTSCFQLCWRTSALRSWPWCPPDIVLKKGLVMKTFKPTSSKLTKKGFREKHYKWWKTVERGVLQLKYFASFSALMQNSASTTICVIFERRRCPATCFMLDDTWLNESKTGAIDKRFMREKIETRLDLAFLLNLQSNKF